MKIEVLSDRRTRVAHMIVGGIREWFEGNRPRAIEDAARLSIFHAPAARVANSYAVSEGDE